MHNRATHPANESKALAKIHRPLTLRALQLINFFLFMISTDGPAIGYEILTGIAHVNVLAACLMPSRLGIWDLLEITSHMQHVLSLSRTDISIVR